MARVKVLEDFDYPSADRQTETRYRKGWVGVVNKAVVEHAGDRVETLEPGEGESEADERLPHNLDPALAEPQALTPNLHERDDSA